MKITGIGAWWNTDGQWGIDVEFRGKRLRKKIGTQSEARAYYLELKRWAAPAPQGLATERTLAEMLRELGRREGGRQHPPRCLQRPGCSPRSS
ncbi:MAG: hypothetical protein HY319_00210 [Armatimonadetes bacterium]|nr:hypothetical protein [Armatimonadota bacterium]